jgi:DNA repair protein RecO (recombination protein O)
VVARPLRVFELGLLHALGYGIGLDSEAASGEPLEPEARYVFEVEHGLCRSAGANAPPDADTYVGRDLIALRECRLDDDGSLRAAQRLLGRVLRVHLGDRPLKSRLVLQDIVSRGL